MGRPLTQTHDVVMANHGMWFAAWEVGSPYIDVYGTSASYRLVKAAYQKGQNDPDSTAVACINAAGDKTGGNNAQHRAYVLKELKAWVAEDGDAYRENGHF